MCLLERRFSKIKAGSLGIDAHFNSSLDLREAFVFTHREKGYKDFISFKGLCHSTTRRNFYK